MSSEVFDNTNKDFKSSIYKSLKTLQSQILSYTDTKLMEVVEWIQSMALKTKYTFRYEL